MSRENSAVCCGLVDGDVVDIGGMPAERDFARPSRN